MTLEELQSLYPEQLHIQTVVFGTSVQVSRINAGDTLQCPEVKGLGTPCNFERQYEKLRR